MTEPEATTTMETTDPKPVENDPTPQRHVSIQDSDDVKPGKGLTDDDLSDEHPFFLFMARRPWPFLVTLPIVFVLLLGFGWSTEDRVEDRVVNLWVAQDGHYAKDINYAQDLGVDDLGSSSFAATAIARDGGNMMTAERLALVRERMEETEGTQVTYKGVNYTWDDFCAINTAPYQFPCLRLSPMDLYEEARWTFQLFDKVAWYQAIVLDTLVAPRVPRFGALTTTCALQCQEVVGYRFITGNPLALFADVGNLEYNHPCKMCLEASYQKTIEDLHGLVGPAFFQLSNFVTNYNARENNTDTEEQTAEYQRIATNLAALSQSITTNDVVDFYKYYVERGLYAQLGAASYLTSYRSFQPYIEQCIAVLGAETCPTHPDEMNSDLAMRDLLRHADNVFSNITTAGAPFPFWSAPDGTGFLFVPSAQGTFHPVSGSGIEMSGNITSLLVYLQTSGGVANPSSEAWDTLVDKNPLYAWFMASLEMAHPQTVCGNGNLTGSPLDPSSFETLAQMTPRWCTPFNIPNPLNQGGQESYSKQHFARMWYDLLISSENFLDVVQGQDDPYSWTTGAGCGYDLSGSRYSYTGQSEEDILSNSSSLVYNIDEGVSLGAVDRHLLLGGATPNIGEYNYDNPLQEVKVLQSLYASLISKDLVLRLKNCNRPGGPIEISEEEADELIKIWKEAMEETWTRGWDDDSSGPVQFVSFYDDGGGVVGSTGRMLEEITLDNTTLTLISIFMIAFFSAIFLFSFDLVESRVLVTMIGVGLVVLSFFSALGFGLLTGIKINVTIAWTLPFVIIGLGVDDVYIVLMALKKQGGYSLRHWLHAMEEIVVPVTMTSLVNAAMFAILNISDIPAVYLTSRVAVYCVIALYLSVIFCFPAYCYLDLIRQKQGRIDVFVCAKSEVPGDPKKDDPRNVILYDKFYKPIVLREDKLRYFFHAVIFAITAALFAVGCYGITEREVGLGLADFFPDDNPAGRWAEIGQETMASWPISMHWGEIDYKDSDTQMLMIKTFEDVVSDRRVGQVDTKQLWIADFLIWTSRHCDENFARPDFDQHMCGRDQTGPNDESIYCAGTWVENALELRLKNITSVTDETCVANEGGICRPGAQMHPADLEEMGLDADSAAGLEFCPSTAGWTDEKFEYCVNKWRSLTGGGGRLLTKEGTGTPEACSNDEAEIVYPIKYSNGPTLFCFDVFTHEQTLDMMKDTREVCDYRDDIHCWITGIPYDYWTQYEDIFEVLLELSGYAILAGFLIAFIFLFARLLSEKNHSVGKISIGALVGAFLIAATMIITLTTVVGLSILSNVNLTAFSNMSFVLSVGFCVEYTVHIISRWMLASNEHSNSIERIHFTMNFLTLPTFMSFVSSTIGTICLAFTEFEFNHKFFFRPLIIVMFVSYWFGCWFLPTLLIYLDFDFLKLGPIVDRRVASSRSLGASKLGLDDSETPEDTERDKPDKSSDDSPDQAGTDKPQQC